ncbi:hypothetical protein BDBG_05508 [Blastomyces gilchristii SLH14081]|uniref:ABM domain-containing protein n=1 Tax=Blastomyces gilchristii (strain SLH14081) TaxID=559298 RepID=A0A179UPK4_BLAGS|nr:uncharacterized protein BDBG_05508 [Blastomyces gilchristii SLH14081]OAT09800.1 hypothetical protein BDBG_05508 [Blastomyces gilchristii SLH14081]
MASNAAVTELIYLTFKKGVKPEDPENYEGRVFTEALEAVKLHSGYLYSSWGRTVEDENDIVWLVAWKDATSSVPLSQISSILAPSSAPITIHTTLTPPVHLKDLTTTPIVELAILPFPSALPFEQKSFIESSLSNLRTALLGICPSDDEEDDPTTKEHHQHHHQHQHHQHQHQHHHEAQKPSSSPSRTKLAKQGPPGWLSLGWVERPRTVEHADSPSGEAELTILVIGWESIQEHEAAMGTDDFEKAFAPVRAKMLPGIKVLEMRYVRFGEEDGSPRTRGEERWGGKGEGEGEGRSVGNEHV